MILHVDKYMFVCSCLLRYAVKHTKTDIVCMCAWCRVATLLSVKAEGSTGCKPSSQSNKVAASVPSAM